jgi:hypothetical protein
MHEILTPQESGPDGNAIAKAELRIGSHLA